MGLGQIIDRGYRAFDIDRLVSFYGAAALPAVTGTWPIGLILRMCDKIVGYNDTIHK